VALTCARCGAQNPDGNQFCQACGTPLTAAAAGAPQGPPPGAPSWIAAPPQPATPAQPPVPPLAGPPPPPGWAVAAPPPPLAAAPPAAVPVAYASPPPLPVAYASPYYAPAAGAPQAAVHRTPWVLIIAGVVGLVVLMAGCGTAIALFNKAGNVSVGITPDVPSPTPAGSPSPVASPVSLSGPIASNDGVTISVPTGWVVDSKDAVQITLTDPSTTGVLSVASAQSNPTSTAEQQKNSIDQEFITKYPDTKACPNTKTTSGSLNGVQGLFWTLCFTLVSGSQSFPAAISAFVGVNGDGSAFYGLLLLSRQDALQSFVTEAAPVVKSIQWKLK
jgi:zinc-ribbon domain